MLTNIERLRLYGAGIIVLVIIVSIAFNISARRIQSDINLLNEVHTLSDALERYKHDYWHYPGSQPADIRDGAIRLTENGFDSGDKVYYNGYIESSRRVTYESDGEDYLIKFSIKREWPNQGLDGNKCQVTKYFSISCID